MVTYLNCQKYESSVCWWLPGRLGWLWWLEMEDAGSDVLGAHGGGSGYLGLKSTGSGLRARLEHRRRDRALRRWGLRFRRCENCSNTVAAEDRTWAVGFSGHSRPQMEVLRFLPLTFSVSDPFYNLSSLSICFETVNSSIFVGTWYDSSVFQFQSLHFLLAQFSFPGSEMGPNESMR